MFTIIKLEDEINAVLNESYLRTVNDNETMEHLANVYRSEVERGFYEGKHEAEGEFPGERRPNEAFMKIAEDMWSPVKDYLNENTDLYSQKSLRELFKTSREYDLAEYDMRIFIGHLLEKATRNFVALFVLYIPHDNPDHSKFNMPEPFHINLLPVQLPVALSRL